MSNEEFKEIKNRAKAFAQSSFHYLEYEGVKDYEVVEDSSVWLCMAGYNAEAGMNELCWAANEASPLINAAKQAGKRTLISFIPEEWKVELIAQGFREYGVMRDYWIDPLTKSLVPEHPCRQVREDEFASASAVTMACRWMSREYHGETEEWMRLWATGKEPNAIACGARACQILIACENAKIAGVICTATYGEDGKKGDTFWIRELAVAPEYQRRGYGKALLLAALGYGYEHGARRAFLMADDCNAVAIALYRKVGFQASAAGAQIDLFFDPGAS